MLRGPVQMPLPGHGFGGGHKMDSYPDNEWNYASQGQYEFPVPIPFAPTIDTSAYSWNGQTQSTAQPRHHSIATSHVVNSSPTSHVQTHTPPPPRQQVASGLVKAQPAFKATWHGFLDTTKDAMTIVEAALQGRLAHISRRPHDKERAEMLKSGTVLVYEENASGIKRWTDAVHWSPSRVMNNCLIYRQLVRALKPEEKKAALNPSCGSKRKRKESASPSITNTGDNVELAEDEYQHSAFETLSGDATPTEPFGKSYANFAQTLTPDQQRRFCGSLVDSYEFKEGGLMKKTISIKYHGNNHHIISYYSLEDVVTGKLQRPFEDPKLHGIQPRSELMSSWKVSPEDEEHRDLPLATGYPQHIQPSHFNHPGLHSVTQGMPMPVVSQAHAPMQMPGSDFPSWHATPSQSFPVFPQEPQQNSSPYAPQATQQFPTPISTHSSIYQQPPRQYQSPQPPVQQYSRPAPPQLYAGQPPATQHYPAVPQLPQRQQYPTASPSVQYSEAQHARITQQPSYAVPPMPYEDYKPVSQQQTHLAAGPQGSLQHHDAHRRASAPVSLPSYSQHSSPLQYPPTQTQGYYMVEGAPTSSPHGY